MYARVSEGYDWIRKVVCAISNNPPASFMCPSQQRNRHPSIIVEEHEQLQPSNKPTVHPSQGIITMTNEESILPTYFTSTTKPRSSLPDGTQCRSVTNPQVCCSSKDSSSTYRDQNCVPAPTGYTFSSGSVCEPGDWVKENETEQVNRFSLLQDGFCNEILEDRKMKLPRLSSCSRMVTNRACCMAKDDVGNPCVPSRSFTRFKTGSRCEPSNFVAETQPENAGTCTVWEPKKANSIL